MKNTEEEEETQKLKHRESEDFENEDDNLEVDATFEDIIEDNEIDVDLLPEKVQKKIADWSELYDSLQEEIEQNGKSDQSEEIVLKLNTLNEGIVSDLMPIVREIEEEAEKIAEMKNNAQNNQMENGGQTQTENQEQNPSWRFWM